MSSKRGGKGQPQGKQYGPKKQTPPPQEPPVVLVQVLLPKGEKSGEFERKMRRRDPDFDKKVEIINSIYNDYGVKVNMKSFEKYPEKFSVEAVLKPFKDSLEFIKKEMSEFFDFNKNNDVNIGLDYDPKKKMDVYASSGPYSGIIFGNLLAGTNIEQIYAYDVKTGHHPQGTTFKDVIIHEFGHSIHNVLANMELLNKNPKASWFDKNINFAHESNSYELGNKIVKYAIKEATGKDAVHLGAFTKKISGYAKENSHEAIAEAMADVRANGKKANSISQSIFKTVKGSFKAGGFEKYVAQQQQKKGN